PFDEKVSCFLGQGLTACVQSGQAHGDLEPRGAALRQVPTGTDKPLAIGGICPAVDPHPVAAGGMDERLRVERQRNVADPLPRLRRVEEERVTARYLRQRRSGHQMPYSGLLVGIPGQRDAVQPVDELYEPRAVEPEG